MGKDTISTNIIKLQAIAFFLFCLYSPVFGQSPEIILKTHHSGSVNAVQYSPDGNLFATAGADNTIKLWSVASGVLLRTLSKHESDIFTIAFSRDGRYLASAGYDRKVIVWDVFSGNIAHTFLDHDLAVTSLAFSADGALLASGSRDKRVSIRDMQDGKLLHTLKLHRGVVTCVAFDAQAQFLVSGDTEGDILIWNPQSGLLGHRLKAHSGGVSSLTFFDGGERLVTVGKDGLIKRWATNTWRFVDLLGKSALPLTGLAATHEGPLLVVTSGKDAQIWDAATRRINHELLGHKAEITAIAFSSDGLSVATSDVEGFVNQWRVQTGTLAQSIAPQSFSANNIAFSPDGKRLASANESGSLKLWDIEKGIFTYSIPAHTQPVSGIAFDPNGRMLASAGLDGSAALWEVKNGTLLQRLSADNEAVYAVGFSPDGRLLATAGQDKMVHLWLAANGQLLRSMSGHLARIWSVDFNPTGSLLVTASDDYTVRIWNVRNGTLLKTLIGHTALVRIARFSPDGRFVASASSDKTIRLWEVGSGRQTSVLQGHTSSVKAVAFSPDGRTLASGGFDNSIRLWDISTGQTIRTLMGHSNDINALAFSGNGSWLASAGADGAVRLWEPLTGETQFVFANLPNSQWLSYRPGSPFYAGSKNAPQFAAIRFGLNIDNLQPLSRFSSELHTDNLTKSLAGPAPVLNRSENAAQIFDPGNYNLWFAGFVLLAIAGLVFAWVLRQKAQPPQSDASHFFSRAGFSDIQSVSGNALLLGANGQMICLALEWRNGHTLGDENLLQTLTKRRPNPKQKWRVYLIYDNEPPDHSEVLRLRTALTCVTIPISSALLANSLSSNRCKETLIELEAAYVKRTDPYYEAAPIQDAGLFFGRKEFLDRIPAELANGGCIALLGLPKIGLTSIAMQLRQRYVDAPVAYLDSASGQHSAEECLTEIYWQLSGLNRSPGARPLSLTDACKKIKRLHSTAGAAQPFLIILDDLLVTKRTGLLPALENLATRKKCISVLITTTNIESVSTKTDPFVTSFQREVIGFFRPATSETMIRGLGALNETSWIEDSVERMFYYCGGHPFVTRLFASIVCKQGSLRKIDSQRVEAAATEVVNSINTNDIGNLFENGIWQSFLSEEKAVIRLIARSKEHGVQQSEIPDKLIPALHTVENYGIVGNDVGRLSLGSHLFNAWLHIRLLAEKTSA